MTWREFLLTTCAWILALVAGLMSYAEVARSKPHSDVGAQLLSPPREVKTIAGASPSELIQPRQ